MEKINAIRKYLQTHTDQRDIYHRKLEGGHEFRIHNNGRSCWVMVDDNVIDQSDALALTEMLTNAHIPQTCRDTAQMRHWIVTPQGVIEENVPGEHL
ncbi:hypothetical protein [Thiohalomonas denitrificans]|uniref:Uncharacterized protein n=1 Tax=Thiohalomonas denitrificans TaxID=415747 RepID=A0A1G5QRB6_9GAMM|nr:hypothetical protein [Thiohalomonas denitrificans]SCZ64128.1 hypothetical protein SAMN03097708_02569 [Thiohalomonas denitrificans]